MGDVDVAVKEARSALQSTSDTANTILKDVVTATEVKDDHTQYYTLLRIFDHYRVPSPHIGYDLLHGCCTGVIRELH